MNPTEEPTEEPTDESITPQPGPALAPGAGMPMVPGPPTSVGPPVPASSYNTGALVYAIVVGVLLMVVVAGLAWLLFGHR